MFPMESNSIGSESQEKTLVGCTSVDLFITTDTIFFGLKPLFLFVVVSTELYTGKPPSSDLKFPNKKDLVNYTKAENVAEITIPRSLVEEKLEYMGEAGKSNVNQL